MSSPALVVRGELSPMLSADTASRRVDEVMRDARLVTVPEASHALPLDPPEASCSARVAFLLD